MNKQEYRDKKSMLIYSTITRPIKIKIPLGYFNENWGAPFIISFMALLMVAASYLAYGFETIANELAVYAYYMLIIGVVLQLISYLKWKKLKREDNGG